MSGPKATSSATVGQNNWSSESWNKKSHPAADFPEIGLARSDLPSSQICPAVGRTRPVEGPGSWSCLSVRTCQPHPLARAELQVDASQHRPARLVGKMNVERQINRSVTRIPQMLEGQPGSLRRLTARRIAPCERKVFQQVEMPAEAATLHREATIRSGVRLRTSSMPTR